MDSKSFQMQNNANVLFIVSTYQSALTLDSLTSSHPIEAEVSSADEIDSQFDDISYDKVRSVCTVDTIMCFKFTHLIQLSFRVLPILRMLNHYLGDDVFRKGLHAYLTKHIYGNAVMADLWEALDSVAEVPVSVKDLMSTWTEQMGFPVISVQRSGEINSDTEAGTISFSAS